MAEQGGRRIGSLPLTCGPIFIFIFIFADWTATSAPRRQKPAKNRLRGGGVKINGIETLGVLNTRF